MTESNPNVDPLNDNSEKTQSVVGKASDCKANDLLATVIKDMNGTLRSVLTVKIAKDPDPSFWGCVGRIGKLLSPVAVIIAVFGFILTTIQYSSRVRELNATTIYNVAKEARLLGRELENGTSSTGEGINFHFTTYYLQLKGLIKPELQPLLLMDFCEFINKRKDFPQTWEKLARFYPDDFQRAVLILRNLPECSSDRVQEVMKTILQSKG